jgi:hypothetical protein
VGGKDLPGGAVAVVCTRLSFGPAPSKPLPPPPQSNPPPRPTPPPLPQYNATFPAFAKLCAGGFGAQPTQPGQAVVVVSEWTRAADIGQPWQRELKAAARELVDAGGWAPLYAARMVRTSRGAAFGCLTAAWGEPWRLYAADAGAGGGGPREEAGQGRAAVVGEELAEPARGLPPLAPAPLRVPPPPPARVTTRRARAPAPLRPQRTAARSGTRCCGRGPRSRRGRWWWSGSTPPPRLGAPRRAPAAAARGAGRGGDATAVNKQLEGDEGVGARRGRTGWVAGCPSCFFAGAAHVAPNASKSPPPAPWHGEGHGRAR